MAHRGFYPFAKPRNEQMQTLKSRMQAHLPCVDRVSFAKYHPRQGMLKSFAESEFDTWCLAQHEAPFRKLHSLSIAADNAIPRLMQSLVTTVKALLASSFSIKQSIHKYPEHYAGMGLM